LPTPRDFVRADTVFVARSAKLPLSVISSWAICKTDLPLVPVRNKIATNSASERFDAPRNTSFSLGLSPIGSSLTFRIFLSL